MEKKKPPERRLFEVQEEGQGTSASSECGCCRGRFLVFPVPGSGQADGGGTVVMNNHGTAITR
ncbi:hypothetical protein [Thiocystis violacea]|uniref:hypothetical protein n=1 Tax=Thiocystis violacea TaxID=13725 RepID=UPI001904561B|nr:hypothetical protein [Thiocystis violacea]